MLLRFLPLYLVQPLLLRRRLLAFRLLMGLRGLFHVAQTAVLVVAVVGVTSVSAADESCSLIVPQNGTAISDGALDILLSWCKDDAACADVYFLDQNQPSRTAFEHLLPNWISEQDLNSPLRTLACDPSTAAKHVWLPLLLAHRRTLAPLCDIDHDFVFDPVTRQQQCICKPDRPCAQQTNDPTALYIVYVLLVIIAIGLFVVSILRTIALSRTLSKLSKDETAGLRALFAAVKG